jgi:hypothetical protein
VGCNVRCLPLDVFAPIPDGEPKCMAVTGSQRGHFYPWPTVDPTEPILPALIVEGELDALIAVQEVGHLVHAGTVGGAGQSPQPSASLALAVCPWWLIATDMDEAGADAAWGWFDRGPEKFRRLLVPSGKDLAEFHQAGGDVAGWIASEIDRLGVAPRLWQPDPADWRWEVACWPGDAWIRWHRRSIALTPKNATAEQIVEAQHAAFGEFDSASLEAAGAN